MCTIECEINKKDDARRNALLSNDERSSILDAEFESWCKEKGIIISSPGLTPSLVPDGWRGVITRCPIQKDECMVRVPRSLLISTESARKDSVLMGVVEKNKNERTSYSIPPMSLFALHLLREASKGSSSEWYPYLKSLPTTYSLGICLTQDEIMNLQVPYAISYISEAREDALKSWRDMQLYLKGLKLPDKLRSWKAWQWALSTIFSRTMFFPPCPVGCLMPWGDLFNHASLPPPYAPNFSYYRDGDALMCLPSERNLPHGENIGGLGSLDETTEEYCLYAKRKYDANEEVYLCYGRHTNLELLKYYGFVFSNERIENPHDVSILDPTEVFPEEVVAQLTNLGTDSAILLANGSPSWELLRALRFAALAPDERRSHAWKVLSDTPVSMKSEFLALQMLANACSKALGNKDKLPTSIMEDRQLLLSNTLNERMSVVVQWRLSYKQTIQKTHNRAVKAMLQLLDLFPDDASTLQGSVSKSSHL